MSHNRLYNNKPFIHEQDDPDESNGPDSPSSGDDYTRTVTTTAPTLKKSRKSIQKRVVSVPIIADVEGSKSRGEAYPPSDSWAWRKYGQKPIKGSPYPRGYYRCSSSKGCPARKQVERSRVDPTSLIITYACEHNHPSPTTTKNSHQSTAITAAEIVIPATVKEEGVDDDVFLTRPDLELGRVVDSPMLDELGWFDHVAPNNPVFESPICVGSSFAVAEVTTVFSMREEDESLFADLGDLPDYSVVFRRNVVEPVEKNRPCSLSPVPFCHSGL